MRIKNAVLQEKVYECEVVTIEANEIKLELAFEFKQGGINLYGLDEIYEENHSDFYYQRYNEFKSYVEKNKEEAEKKIFNLLRFRMMTQGKEVL